MDREAKLVLFVGRPVPTSHPIRLRISKIGGTPVGITEEQWPMCGQCGRHMDFLLQLDLRKPLALSQRYSFAYFFMCHGYLDPRDGKQCMTWPADAGGNAIVLAESSSAAATPGDLGVREWPEFGLEFSAYIPPDVRNRGMDQRFLDFLTGALERAGDEEEIEVVAPEGLFPDDRPDTVLLGGDPRWLQQDETPTCPICDGPMRLLAEVDSEVRNHSLGLPGDSGIRFPFGGGVAFAFICEKECSPRGTALLWQTT